MEQLDGPTLERLLRRARGEAPTGPADRPPSPWRARAVAPGTVPAARLPRPEPDSAHPLPDLPDVAIRPVGPTEATTIERRLVRRAERLWRSLKPDGALPPAAAVASLLQPPFGSQSVLLLLPLAGPVRVAFVGEALAGLRLLDCGRAPTGDSTGARLCAMGVASTLRGGPMLFDSDLDTPGGGLAPRPGAPALLMRAIALPFAGSGAATGAAVIVASWRKLLSATETAALHAELAAAIGRIRPRGDEPAGGA